MFDIPSIFLPDIIAGHARRHPAKPALICDDALLTWQELADAIDNFASFLLARGIGRGARIGVLAEPTSRAVVAELGALRAGAGVASLSGMASGEALARMIADAAPSLLVIDDHFSSLTASATAAGGPLLELAPTVKIGAALEGELAFEDAVASGRGRRAISFPRLEREDEFVILYSSGTTGEPKGIVLTHGCRLSHCMIIAMEQGYGPNAIVLGGTALYSNTTWSYVTLALFAGGTAVVMRKFDGREAVDLMARWRVTHALLVPAMLRMMLETEGQDALDFTAVKAICTTGSSIPLPIKRQAMARFPGAYFEIYGLTEGFMLMLRPEEAEQHMESVGKPMLGHDIRIIDLKGLVHTPRTYITHHHRQVLGQFTLYIEVPLHYVTAMGVPLNG